MEDLLRALIQDQQPRSSSYATRSGPDPLAQALQGLLGGATPQDQSAQAGPVEGGLDLGGLLQAFLGGADQAPQGYAEQTGSGSFPSGLNLASVLEDGPGETLQAPQTYGQQAGAGSVPAGLDLGSLLQAVLGGGGSLGGAAQPAASEAGGFGDLLGGIMGGGSSTMASDPFLAPIVNGLAEKLGLPPQIVQAVVAFVMGKLLGNRLQPGLAELQAAGPSRKARQRATTVEDIRQKMNRRQRVTKKELRSSGLVTELSKQTGLDRATAEASLQEVLDELGGQIGAGE
jgi:hypothetical protein